MRVTPIITIALLLQSFSALGQSIDLKPKLIVSRMVRGIESLEYIQGVEEEPKHSNGPIVGGLGVGIDVVHELNDITSAGLGLSYTEFPWEYSMDFDSAIGGFVALDLLKKDDFGMLYMKGGLSFHRFGHDHYVPASLWNVDVGGGVLVGVSQSIDVGFEYLYSTSVIKGEEKGKKYGDRIKGVSETRQDYSIFLTFKLSRRPKT